MASKDEKVSHYNDWPNSCGFDVRHEELNPHELEVTGNIPAYCAGVLFRNGLGPRELHTDKKKIFRTNHWFDSLSQVHRFQIHAATADHPQIRVTHNSRRTCDGLIDRIMKTGNLAGFTFAAKYDPCMSLFQKLQSIFQTSPQDTPDTVNVSVTLSPNFPGLASNGTKQEKGHDSSKIQTLVNKTDNSLMQMLDPETLEPIGIARQSVLHPDLKGPVSGAHAKLCSKTGDVYNYNLEFGRTGSYRVFCVSAATGKCSILATISGKPAYLHSSFLSENYFILCVWNSHFSAGGASILWTKNYLDALSEFDANKPATWYVIDRVPESLGGRGLVATYESDPFFCFHTINAYEEQSATIPNQTNIIADLCAYDSLDVLKRFYIDNMRSDSPSAKAYADPTYISAKAYYRRFRLPNVPTESKPATELQQQKRQKQQSVLKAESIAKGSKGLAPELPSLNHSFRGRKHRFVYGVIDTGKSTFFDGVVKLDCDTCQPAAVWCVFGQSAGEPIFIKDPTCPDEEDGGVLLTVVLDGIEGRSYLLVLDAKDLKELGRASMKEGPGGVVGFGFHGAHVRAASTSEGC